MNVFDLVGTLSLQADSFFSTLETAAAAVADFIESSVEVGMAFDSSMARVAAISGEVTDEQLGALIEQAHAMGLAFEEGADAASTGFNILRALALQTGASTMFTAKQSADAMKYMAMAGWDATEMLQGLPGIVNLSAASGIDLARTSDIVTDSLTAFRLNAEDAAYFADLLAITSARANTNVDLMGQTFKFVAPIAGAYGVAAEDIALATGLLANNGIKATQAGTTLRSILSRIATDTGATDKTPGARGLIEQLGVDFYTDTGEVRDFSEFLFDLREKWSDVSVEEQAALAKQIAGQYASTGFLALMNTSEEDFRALEAAIRDCEGAAESMSSVMLDNLGGSLTILHSAIEGLQIAISDVLTPLFQPFVTYATESVQTITAAFRRDGIDGVLGVIEQIAAQGVDLIEEKLPEIQELAQKVTSAITTALDILGPHITELMGVIGGAIGEFLQNNSATVVEGIANLTLALLPGIVALVEGIADGIVAGWPTIKGAINQVIDSLMPVLNDVMEMLRNMIFEWYDGSWLQKAIISIPIFGGAINDALMDAFGPPIQTAEEQFNELIETMTDQGTAEGVKQVFRDVSETVNGVATSIENAKAAAEYSETIQKALDLINGSTENLKKSISDIGDQLVYSPTLIETAFSSAEAIMSQIDAIAGVATESAPELQVLRDKIAALFDTNIYDEIYITVDSEEAIKIIDQVVAELAALKDKYVTITTYTQTIPINDAETYLAPEKAAGTYTGKASTRSATLNAISMSSGRILQGATMFGWDENGRPQIGGGEGAEAVVGVTSLDQMIQNSVKNAVGGILGRLDSLVNGQDREINVYLDTGVLVGAIAPNMDGELSRIASWKGGGRA